MAELEKGAGTLSRVRICGRCSRAGPEAAARLTQLEGRARRSRWPLGAVVAVLAIPIAPWPLVVDRPVHRPDAIVVLASHEWERIPAAAHLARLEPSAKVVLTVFRRSTEKSCHLCPERPRWLNHLGVDGDRILEVLAADDSGTKGEAVAVANLARERGWRRILVLTSVYHTRRSLWTFLKVAGGQFEVGVASATGFSRLNPRRWWADPEDRWYVAYEWAALLTYAAMGRLGW